VSSRPHVLSLHIRNELVSARRSVEYVIGLVVVPTVLYVMFAIWNDSTWTPDGRPFSTLAIASFACYGVVSLAIFTFCDDVAKERTRGWIKTMAATPLSLSHYLWAKVGTAVGYSVAIVTLLAVVSITGQASTLKLSEWLMMTLVLIGGLVAFSTIGFAVAFLARPKAATVLSNLVFLPLAFGSGFFFPLSEVPEFARTLAPYLPSYHLGRLTWSTFATETEIDLLQGIPGQGTAVHVTWVLGTFIAGAALTWWSTRQTRL
jgi:ABC-2 type transport system permease protein